MSCNSCAKSFNLVRKERGCPRCGFSYCSKCLGHTIFSIKFNSTVKVCGRCKNGESNTIPSNIDPPAALKRLASLNEGAQGNSSKDVEIQQLFEKLKEGTTAPVPTQREIEERLQRIKEVPVATDEEIRPRLNRLRGEPTLTTNAQVCGRCKNGESNTIPSNIDPPAALKRLASLNEGAQGNSSKDVEIQQLFEKLKEGTTAPVPTQREIEERLQRIKEVPVATDEEIRQRLNRLRGEPTLTTNAQVCGRCKNGESNTIPSNIDPPAALKRLASLNEGAQGNSSKDVEIQQLFEKLKEGTTAPVPTQREIEERLQRIKEVPVATDEEIRQRLNRLRGEPTLTTNAQVCGRCKNGESNTIPSNIDPPAALKRLASLNEGAQGNSSKDVEIQQLFEKLKEGTTAPVPTQREIEERLQRIKEVPVATDEEIRQRLNRLRGEPTLTTNAQTAPLPPPETRSAQRQADDLLSQYLAEAATETRYQEEFQGLVRDMETRLGNLRGAAGAEGVAAAGAVDEEEDVRKIVEKCKREAILEDSLSEEPEMEELPFCEICNEDATLRCLGCRYLFCKRCYLEHKDDDDGCNRYEPYKP